MFYSRGRGDSWKAGLIVHFFFEHRGYREHLLFFPRAADDLHSDRHTLDRIAHGNYGRRIAQQVEEFCIAPGIEIADSLAFDLPTALAVAKCRNRRYRT